MYKVKNGNSTQEFETKYEADKYRAAINGKDPSEVKKPKSVIGVDYGEKDGDSTARLVVKAKIHEDGTVKVIDVEAIDPKEDDKNKEDKTNNKAEKGS